MNSTRLAFVDSKSGKTYHGTVKYSGAVAPTAGDWLGVEWDDETRGKHDGVYSPTGVRYFYCDVAGAGSFIRPSAPGISFGISFGPALRLKYTPELASDLNDPSPATRSEFYSTASNFKIEVVSSSKVDSNTRRLSRLRDVGLAGEGVSHAGDDEELDAVTAELTSESNFCQSIYRILTKTQAFRPLISRIRCSTTSLRSSGYVLVYPPCERFCSSSSISLCSSQLH